MNKRDLHSTPVDPQLLGLDLVPFGPPSRASAAPQRAEAEEAADAFKTWADKEGLSRDQLLQIAAELTATVAELKATNSQLVEQSKELTEAQRSFLKQIPSALREAAQIGAKKQKSTQARVNAFKSHEEDHSMKGQVYEWLDANMKNYRTMSAATDEIAGKLVPASWQTVRKWVTAWKKDRAWS